MSDGRQVFAVVVSWNPQKGILDNITEISRQVERVIVVDNASEPGSRDILDRLSEMKRVQVVKNAENLGIAAALNIGVRCAQEAGCSWIATFDQDSRVPPNYIATMLNGLKRCSEEASVALLAPLYRDPHTGQVVSHGTKTTLTSGNLVRVETFERVGLYREEFFIDYVDFEFCLRCWRNGLAIIEVNDAILDHCVGEPTCHRIINRAVSVSNHSPLRLYYRFRNRIAVFQEYYSHEREWMIKDLRAFIMEILKISLFESRRCEKILAIFCGVRDGIMGRMGKRNAMRNVWLLGRK